MAIIVNNLKLNLGDNVDKLKALAAKELRIGHSEIRDLKILRESIDARKGDVKLVYKVSAVCPDENGIMKKCKSKNACLEKSEETKLELGSEPLKDRPVVIGSGPAGLFCAYLLAKHGYSPLLLERGKCVDERKTSIEKFWSTGELDPDTNVQFGEGGAGTFSDGKLTTRIKDSRVQTVIESFVKNGAPEEIAYSHKPHIGTDILIDVVRSMREEIVALGGEVRFSNKVTGILSEGGALTGVVVNGDTKIPCQTAVFAIGHSARDTYKMLYDNGISMEQKPFAMGVRVEHHQDTIDDNQYGKHKDHPKLKASEYKLTHKASTGRSCYSFCMCPGGTVVGSSSEEGMLVVNGMSEYARDKANANSAVVVSVNPEDFGSSHPLAGIEFQRKYERLAFELGGGNYSAPIQLLGDFLENRASAGIGKIKPSYTGGYVLEDLSRCLPDFVADTIKESMVAFERKIKGFSDPDTVLTGIETRTSAPVRIGRQEDLQSSDINGLYPCGEGAGYAGGIVSAAVDGLKVAESIIKKFKPF